MVCVKPENVSLQPTILLNATKVYAISYFIACSKDFSKKSQI